MFPIFGKEEDRRKSKRRSYRIIGDTGNKSRKINQIAC